MLWKSFEEACMGDLTMPLTNRDGRAYSYPSNMRGATGFTAVPLIISPLAIPDTSPHLLEGETYLFVV